MKILITTGGTAGHIFPALEVRKALQSENHDVLFHCFQKENLFLKVETDRQFQDIRAYALTFRSIKGLYSFVFGNIRAIFLAKKILKNLKPEIVIGFGSYASVPLVLAAKLLNIPILIHEQNVIPGQANRLLGFFAKKILTSFIETQQSFPKKKVVHVGYPCFRKKEDLKKESIYREFGLQKDKKTILVFGGSQGSKVLNEIFFNTFVMLEDEFQVIHVTGKKEFDFVQNKYSGIKRPFVIFDFLQEMEKAYMISDLVISRAGAATIFELAEFQIHSILIPFPHANGHQKKNAEVLQKKGLATIIEEDFLSEKNLKKEIIQEITKQRDYQRDKGFFQDMFIPKAAEKIVNEITGLKT